MVTAACGAAGVSRATAYRRRLVDEPFADTRLEAERDVVAMLDPSGTNAPVGALTAADVGVAGDENPAQ
jgi:hypothetical protein